MGRGGIYYRKTLSPSAGSGSQLPQYNDSEPIPNYAESRGVGPMIEIESGDVTAMVDSSSTELLHELDEKKKKLRFGPIVTILAVLGAVGLFAAEAPPLLQVCVALLGAVAIYFAFRRDTLVKTVVLFYVFDPTLERAYATLHESAAKLASCTGHWHISASAKVYERKYHAGASALVDRKSTPVRRAAPPFLKTNIETVSIGVGRQTMFLFPDRVLVYESGKVGAIGYDQLQVSVSQTKFVEDSAPSDARVVGQTWRYVNKNGGPDRRFANNRMLPICLYDELHFTSPSGLNEVIQSSQCGVGESLHDALAALNSELSQARTQSPTQQTPELTFQVGRNGEQLGELPLSTIKQMLSRGELSMQDYFFDFDQNSWLTLDRIEQLKH